MESSTYYFHMKVKIFADFQICVSVPLNKKYNRSENILNNIFNIQLLINHKVTS